MKTKVGLFGVFGRKRHNNQLLRVSDVTMPSTSTSTITSSIRTSLASRRPDSFVFSAEKRGRETDTNIVLELTTSKPCCLRLASLGADPA